MSGTKVKSNRLPPAPRWFYSGDVNIEHGGMFYRLNDWHLGDVQVVRVQPCSDAGGPDNMWWIEHLTVTVVSPRMPFRGVGATAEQRKAHRILHDMEDSKDEVELCACGWDGDNLETWDKMTIHQRKCAIVEALVSYGRYDKEQSGCIRIGKEDPFFGGNHAGWLFSVELRAGSSLKRYVKEQCRTR